MATKTKKRRRPGYPRGSSTLNRLTLRMDLHLAVRMNQTCDRRNLTQRELVEAALTDELADPVPNMELPPEADVYRTGLWIDPALFKAMDKQIDKERKLRTTQRGIIERAVLRYITKYT